MDEQNGEVIKEASREIGITNKDETTVARAAFANAVA
jgi:hypothetical protein